MRTQLLTIAYPVAVICSFLIGFLFRNQVREGWSFFPAVVLTLPWSVFPDRFLPNPLNAFLGAFYDLPLIVAGMTLNIACVGVVQMDQVELESQSVGPPRSIGSQECSEVRKA